MAVILFAVYAVSSLALPTLMSAIVDDGINALDFDYVIRASLMMLAIAAIGLVSYIYATKLCTKISSDFSANLRADVFKKATSLGFDEFNKIGPSALLTRTSDDIFMLEELVWMLTSGAITIPILMIGGSVLAFTKDVYLSLILFAFAPILIVAVYLVAKKVHPLWELADKHIDVQNQIIRERLSGIRVIRAFNREDRECKRAAKATEIMSDNLIRSNVHMGLLSPVAILILNVATILMLFIGLNRIQLPRSSLSAGDILAVVQYVSLIMSGIMTLAWSLVFLPRAKVNIMRISEVFDAKGIPAATDTYKPQFEGSIRFEDVEFSYEGADEPAVTGINMDIPAGSKVAIIGGTGAGKSTIVQTLLGFYAPTHGTLYFDGVSSDAISSERIRDNISCVLQKGTIFAASIFDNIAIWRKDVTEDDVRAVAELAELAGFVDSLEEGFKYELQQHGTNVSGGQKQRVAIARALLKKAPIYIFDDSFSALDFMTEGKIRKKLNEYLKGKTQIIVTQRVTSAMFCDAVYVMDKGKIVGHGTHDELLKSCEIYREIYKSQTGRAA